MQSLNTAFFVFALLLSLHIPAYARVSCWDRLFIVSGKGSSGLLRTKKGRGGKPFRRQSPHFHFITGSILAVKPYLS